MQHVGVHVWSVDLDADRGTEADVLSADELERAERFHFDVHRNRFVACRQTLRHILSTWIGVPAGDLAFVYGANGKPALGGSGRPHFNVTHSEGWAMIAVCADHPVGIDMEWVRILDELPQLTTLVFTDRERQQIERMPDHDRLQAFFRGWSRKEAYFKATGDGLSAQLHSVTVDVAAHDPGILDIGGGDIRAWSMHDLPAPAGFVGAAAIPCRTVEIVFHREPVSCAH